MPSRSPRPSRQPAAAAGGVYAAVVTRVVGALVYVVADRLSPGNELRGEALEGAVLAGLGTAAASGHSHGITTAQGPLAEGDRVYVALVEGRPNDVLVLGRVWNGSA